VNTCAKFPDFITLRAILAFNTGHQQKLLLPGSASVSTQWRCVTDRRQTNGRAYVFRQHGQHALCTRRVQQQAVSVYTNLWLWLYV